MAWSRAFRLPTARARPPEWRWQSRAADGNRDEAEPAERSNSQEGKGSAPVTSHMAANLCSVPGTSVGAAAAAELVPPDPPAAPRSPPPPSLGCSEGIRMKIPNTR